MAKGMNRLTRQHIEAIGNLIAERRIEPEKARQINGTVDGWSYKHRRHGRTFNAGVRYSHVQLTDEELELALKFADDVNTNPNRFQHDTSWWWRENAPGAVE